MSSDAAGQDVFAQFGPVEIEQLSRIQKIVAKKLTENAATIPHVTHNDEVDITRVEKAREKQSSDVKVTTLIFVIRGVVEALKAFPRFNASLSPDGSALVLKKYFHIGVAVDYPNGLLVPVIRDCDRKSLTEIASELSGLVAKARDKGLPYEAMTGGCMSISSLGGIGGTSFSPIINAPEVAILGVTRNQMKPVWDGAAFQPRQMLPLSLSYDHRVINGADAARFVRKVGEAMDTLAAQILQASASVADQTE
jgi:pyruvate dehydrogenase E2 component (dihydrolipoamide acetyltransferase)